MLRHRAGNRRAQIRILLPNGGHFTGLSTNTFGDSALVKVSEGGYVLRRFLVNERWLEFADSEQQRLFRQKHESTAPNIRFLLVGGFAFFLLFLCIHCHKLSTDYPAELLRWAAWNVWLPNVARSTSVSIADVYAVGVTFAAACLILGLLASCIMDAHDRVRPAACDAKRSTLVYVILRHALILLRVCYVGMTAVVWRSYFTFVQESRTSGGSAASPSEPLVSLEHQQAKMHELVLGLQSWTIDFCLCGVLLRCSGNGLSNRENCLILLIALAALFPCFATDAAATSFSRDQTCSASENSVSRWMIQGLEPDVTCAVAAAVSVILKLGRPLLFSVLSYRFSRIESAAFLSTWISLQVTASAPSHHPRVCSITPASSCRSFLLLVPFRLCFLALEPCLLC